MWYNIKKYQEVLYCIYQVRRPDVALAIHPGVHTDAMMALWRPTLQLLAKECVPLAMTTYNLAEYEQTLEVLCVPTSF